MMNPDDTVLFIPHRYDNVSLLLYRKFRKHNIVDVVLCIYMAKK